MDAYQIAMQEAGLRLTDETDDRKISWRIQLTEELYLRVLYYDANHSRHRNGHYIDVVGSESIRPDGNPQELSYEMSRSSPEVFKAVLEAIIKTYRP